MLNCGRAGFAAVDRRATVVRRALNLALEGPVTPSPDSSQSSRRHRRHAHSSRSSRRSRQARSRRLVRHPPVDPHAALTPIVGVTAHARLDAMLVLAITLCHVVHHILSVLARFRVLRVPSRWPLRRPPGAVPTTSLIVPLTGVSPSLPSTRVALTSVGVSSLWGRHLTLHRH